MPKVWNKRDPNTPKDAVYVGRPTVFGNAYVIGQHGTREQVIEKYRATMSPQVKAACLNTLRGRDLVCWCAPKPCHADVLLEIANQDLKDV